MNFAIIISLILLIIQSTLSSPVAIKETVQQEHDDYNNFLTIMIENLTDIQKQVEFLHSLGHVYYGNGPESQQLYERSKSFLHKLNNYIQVALNETGELKAKANLKFQLNAVTNLYYLFVYTMIDIAGENYEISTMNSNPIVDRLDKLMNDFLINLAIVEDTKLLIRRKELLHNLNVDHVVNNKQSSILNATVLDEICDDYNKLLTYIIEKLSKIENELKLEGLTTKPVEYYDYNIFFNYMMEKFNNLQQNSGSETQFKQFNPELMELNYYILHTLMASKQIQANINHTSFGGKDLYYYEQDKISMLENIIQYIWDISNENSILLPDMEDDFEIFRDKLDSIKQKQSNLYYKIS